MAISLNGVYYTSSIYNLSTFALARESQRQNTVCFQAIMKVFQLKLRRIKQLDNFKMIGKNKNNAI
jgi:hypothetical protein